MTPWYCRGECGEFILSQVESVLDGMINLDQFKFELRRLGLDDDEIHHVMLDEEFV